MLFLTSVSLFHSLFVFTTSLWNTRRMLFPLLSCTNRDSTKLAETRPCDENGKSHANVCDVYIKWQFCHYSLCSAKLITIIMTKNCISLKGVSTHSWRNTNAVVVYVFIPIVCTINRVCCNLLSPHGDGEMQCDILNSLLSFNMIVVWYLHTSIDCKR